MSSSEALEAGKLLLFAARDGDLAIVMEQYRKNSPFVNDWLGSNALHLACQNNHEKIVEYLLSAGISRDARTKTERTALHFAAFNGREDIVEMLLREGAKANCIDMLGMTPLHWACQNQHHQCVQILLEYGIDIHVVNKFGKTASQIAEEVGNQDISNLIVNHSTKELKQELKDSPKNAESEDTSKDVEIKSSHSDEEDDEHSEHPRSASVNRKQKRKSKPTDGPPAKRKVQEAAAEDDAIDKVLPFFQDSGSLSPSEAERQARTLRILENHGIKMLPNDDSTVVASAVKNGQTVCLTEAGKMALKAVEIPALSPSSLLNNSGRAPESPATSPEVSLKKNQSQSKEIVHVNSLHLKNKNLEGKRIIKIRADQLRELKKNNKILLRSAPKSPGKFSDSEAELKEALNTFNVNEAENSCRIDESDFDEVVKQLSASQALVKLYRQQLISKEKEVQMYKQLLLQTNNQLKSLQQNLSRSV
nr:PREDICTED: ankyrin repeat domain-containing protein 10-like [Bemisia tabaci]